MLRFAPLFLRYLFLSKARVEESKEGDPRGSIESMGHLDFLFLVKLQIIACFLVLISAREVSQIGRSR